MEIITYPDERLFTVSEPIVKIDEGIITFAEKMIDKMYLVKALGLAAIQVGEPIRMFVCDVDGDPLVAINPFTINLSPIQLPLVITSGEGCLSLPYLFAEVPRNSTISLHYYDLDDKSRTVVVTGKLAFVFQHEMDHLDGILYWNRLSPLKRSLLRKKYLKMHKFGR